MTISAVLGSMVQQLPLGSPFALDRVGADQRAIYQPLGCSVSVYALPLTPSFGRITFFVKIGKGRRCISATLRLGSGSEAA